MVLQYPWQHYKTCFKVTTLSTTDRGIAVSIATLLKNTPPDLQFYHVHLQRQTSS